MASEDSALPFTFDKSGTSRVTARKGEIIIAQGAPADSVFYVKEGKVKILVVSEQGKEAVVAILGPGDFFGEGCLTGQTIRMASVAAMGDCTTIRIDKATVVAMIRDDKEFSGLFTAHLLNRNVRVEADLIDQLFNSSEKRLARLLLILANFGKEGKPEPIIPPITQEMLAEMVGTTRSRVSFFMNKFRQLGFIEYNGHLEVHSSLLGVVLHEEPREIHN